MLLLSSIYSNIDAVNMTGLLCLQSACARDIRWLKMKLLMLYRVYHHGRKKKLFITSNEITRTTHRQPNILRYRKSSLLSRVFNYQPHQRPSNILLLFIVCRCYVMRAIVVLLTNVHIVFIRFWMKLRLEGCCFIHCRVIIRNCTRYLFTNYVMRGRKNVC